MYRAHLLQQQGHVRDASRPYMYPDYFTKIYRIIQLTFTSIIPSPSFHPANPTYNVHNHESHTQKHYRYLSFFIPLKRMK